MLSLPLSFLLRIKDLGTICWSRLVLIGSAVAAGAHLNIITALFCSQCLLCVTDTVENYYFYINAKALFFSDLSELEGTIYHLTLCCTAHL